MKPNFRKNRLPEYFRGKLKDTKVIGLNEKEVKAIQSSIGIFEKEFRSTFAACENKNFTVPEGNGNVTGNNILHFLSDNKTGSCVRSMLQMALDCGVDVKHENSEGRTPFHNAAYVLNFEAMKIFLERKEELGLDINAPIGNSGLTVLMLAAVNEPPNTMLFVKELLEAGADPLIEMSGGLTVIDFVKNKYVKAYLQQQQVLRQYENKEPVNIDMANESLHTMAKEGENNPSLFNEQEIRELKGIIIISQAPDYGNKTNKPAMNRRF